MNTKVVLIILQADLSFSVWPGEGSSLSVWKINANSRLAMLSQALHQSLLIFFQLIWQKKRERAFSSEILHAAFTNIYFLTINTINAGTLVSGRTFDSTDSVIFCMSNFRTSPWEFRITSVSLHLRDLCRCDDVLKFLSTAHSLWHTYLRFWPVKHLPHSLMNHVCIEKWKTTNRLVFWM